MGSSTSLIFFFFFSKNIFLHLSRLFLLIISSLVFYSSLPAQLCFDSSIVVLYPPPPCPPPPSPSARTESIHFLFSFNLPRRAHSSSFPTVDTETIGTFSHSRIISFLLAPPPLLLYFSIEFNLILFWLIR